MYFSKKQNITRQSFTHFPTSGYFFSTRNPRKNKRKKSKGTLKTQTKTKAKTQTKQAVCFYKQPILYHLSCNFKFFRLSRMCSSHLFSVQTIHFPNHSNYLKNSFTLSFGTISSWKKYAPVLGDFTILMHLVCARPELSVLKVATAFFAIVLRLSF